MFPSAPVNSARRWARFRCRGARKPDDDGEGADDAMGAGEMIPLPAAEGDADGEKKVEGDTAEADANANGDGDADGDDEVGMALSDAAPGMSPSIVAG